MSRWTTGLFEFKSNNDDHSDYKPLKQHEDDASDISHDINNSPSFNDLLYTCCCFPCSIADIFQLINDNTSKCAWYSVCCASCLIPFIPPSITRIYASKKYNIDSNVVTDCCTGTFCSCCSNAQILREIRTRGPVQRME
ncbi:hypothetical protein ABK040_000124 [Willaertia magna]